MSYPKNAASPPRIAVGAVVQISDGAVQTTGTAVVVRPEGGAEGAGGGTLECGASGIHYYTPTQAETNYSAFVVCVTKSGCIPAAVTVVTEATATAGQVVASNLPAKYSGSFDWADVVNKPTIGTSTLDGSGVQAALTAQGYTTTRAGYLDVLNGLVAAIWAAATTGLTGVGSIGKWILDKLDVTVSSRHAAGAAVAKSPATLDWLNDVSNKPTIGDATAANQATMATTIGTAVTAANSAATAATAAQVAAEAITPGGDATAANQTAILEAIGNIDVSGGGDATLANQEAMIAKLDVINAKTATIGTGGAVTVTSPVSASGSAITIVRGDDYNADDGRQIDLSFSDGPDITAATAVTMTVRDGADTIQATFTGAVLTSGGATQSVRFQPTATQTKAMAEAKPGSPHKYDVEITLADGHIITPIVGGRFYVVKDQTTH